MRSKPFKSVLVQSGLAASILLLASGASFGQQVVNLTAAPATAFLPDGSTVPMWGYSCGALGAGVTSTATCASLNPNAPAERYVKVIASGIKETYPQMSDDDIVAYLYRAAGIRGNIDLAKIRDWVAVA